MRRYLASFFLFFLPWLLGAQDSAYVLSDSEALSSWNISVSSDTVHDGSGSLRFGILPDYALDTVAAGLWRKDIISMEAPEKVRFWAYTPNYVSGQPKISLSFKGDTAQSTTRLIELFPGSGWTYHEVDLSVRYFSVSRFLVALSYDMRSSPQSGTKVVFLDQVEAVLEDGTVILVEGGETPVPIPSYPAAIAPANGSEDVPKPVMHSWNASSDATMYYIQVAYDANFQSLAADDSTAETSYETSVVPYGNTMYWRLSAGNEAGKSGWSPVWIYHTESEPVTVPAVPVQIAPANGGQDVGIPIDFLWNSSEGSTEYGIQVSENPSFSSFILNGATADTSMQVSAPYNKTLYWRVIARNGEEESGWSPIWSFHTESEPVTVPAAPRNLHPAEGAAEQPLTVTLRCSASEGATQYGFMVLKSYFVVKEGVVSDTFMTVSGLEEGTEYSWQVYAENSAGKSLWSRKTSFTTLQTSGGMSPELVSPLGTAGVSLTPQLVWNGDHDVFWVQVLLNGSPVVNDSSVVSNVLAVSVELEPNTLYYWRVRGRMTEGIWGDWSHTTGSFTTRSVASNDPPVFALNDGSADVPIPTLISWSGTADYFWIQIFLNEELVFNRDDLAGNSVAVSPPLLCGTTYSMRGRAKRDGVWSEWSGLISFSTVDCEVNFEIVYPLDGTTDLPVPFVERWRFVPDADRYWVQISLPSGTVAFQNGEVYDTTLMVADLAPNTAYDTRVAYLKDGNWTWSRVHTFVTASNGAPSLLTPANNTTNAPVRPTEFVWMSVENAWKYDIYVSQRSDFLQTAFSLRLQDTRTETWALKPNTTYYWRVRALDYQGNPGSWSDTYNFFTTGGLTGMESLEGIPEEYSLFQNYPNPFNPGTVIRFGVPEASEVDIRIYGISGEEVFRFHKSVAAGFYEVSFDASDLPSGIYVCRLVSGNFSESRKMMLIK